MFFHHKHAAPLALAIFRHDGYWELRRGTVVVERFIVLDDALRYQAQLQAKAA